MRKAKAKMFYQSLEKVVPHRGRNYNIWYSIPCNFHKISNCVVVISTNLDHLSCMKARLCQIGVQKLHCVVRKFVEKVRFFELSVQIF